MSDTVLARRLRRVPAPVRAALNGSRRFLKKLVRSIPAALALLIALGAAWAAVLASFLVMLAPHWSVLGLPVEAAPAGRLAFFVVCVASAWAAGRIKRALALWLDRLCGPQGDSKPAGRAELRAWRPAAVELADKIFWVMAAALAMLMLAQVKLDPDPAFHRAVEVVTRDAGRWFNAAVDLVFGEIIALPADLGALAGPLFFALFFYPLWRAALQDSERKP